MKARFLSIVLLLLPFVAYAYDAKINGIYYNFIGDKAIVTYQNYQQEYKANGSLVEVFTSDYMDDVVIPTSVTFEGKTYSVTSIGDNAFRECVDITSVTIPESVDSIGINAFRQSGIFAIDFPESVKYIGAGAFMSCENLTSVTIPKGVEKLEASTFYYSNLETVTLQEGLTFIDEWAFGNCTGLTEITIPKGVTHIAGAAFYECDKLTSVNLPESLNTIGQFTFCGCSSLASIDIPENVDSLGKSCFARCYGLTSVKFQNKLERIKSSTFYGCISLTSITFPKNIISIGEYAFTGCTGLKSLNIPETVSSIGLFAFGLCNGLTSIKVDEGNAVYDSRDNCNAIIETANNNLILGCITTEFPNSLKSIYVGAFYGLTDMTSVTVPEGVESLYDGAFQYCSGLTSVTLPSSVKFIDDYVFYNCYSLKDFYCYAEDIPETFENTFYGVPFESATLHVPTASLDKYKTTTPWSNFGNIVPQTTTSLNTIGMDVSSNIPVCYDLSGCKIDPKLSTFNSQHRKGIFIQNGKKFIGK